MSKKMIIFIGCFLCLKCFSIDTGSHILQEETTLSTFFKPIDGVREDPTFETVDCIYVINLDKRPEKWTRTRDELDKYDVVFNRFSAINGWTMAKERLDDLWAGQKCPASISPGKLGCILSHLSVLQDAYDRGYECIWILQDDIEIFRDMRVIDGYIKKLSAIDPEWSLLFTDLDMRGYEHPGELLRALCITGAFRNNQQTMPEKWYLTRTNINDDFQEIRLRYGFHSVLVSRHGMECILNYFKRVVLHTGFDIDIHFIPGLRKYGLRDPIISNACDWKLSDSSKPFITLQDLPYPYNQLKEILPFNNHGWYANSVAMEALLKEHGVKVVVELGSWLGKSTRHIAKHLPHDGKVYAIDHWLGNVEHQTPERTDVYHLLPTLYEQFLSNIIHDHLTDKIIPWRMTTGEAAEKMKSENIRIDLVYVDAAHDEQNVYDDLCNWYPFVEKNGILCGDDWSWGEDYPVRRAVERFAYENGLIIDIPSWNFWVLYK